MNPPTSPQTVVWRTIQKLEDLGFNDYQKFPDLLLRALRTRQAVRAQQLDSDLTPEELFDILLDATPDLLRFPINADLFAKVYATLEPIQDELILLFLRTLMINRELMAPDCLLQLFTAHIPAPGECAGMSILVSECEQFSQTLLRVMEEHSEKTFTVTFRHPEWHELLSTVYKAYPNVHICPFDVATLGFTADRFDLILAMPHIGCRTVIRSGDFLCREHDQVVMQNMLYHLRENGTLVILISVRTAYSGDSAVALRKYVEKHYQIREIGVLPDGLLAPYTSIRTFLMTLGNGHTDSVHIDQYKSDPPVRRAQDSLTLVPQQSKDLSLTEFNVLPGWNIEQSFVLEDADLRQYRNTRIKKYALRDVAQLFRGKAAKGQATGNIGVVNIANFGDNGVDYAHLDRIDEDERTLSRYLLQEGDVMITARGSAIRTALFTKQALPCIPSVNINVVRPRHGIQGMFIKIFLDSPLGQKLLSQQQRGVVVLNINVRDMGDLEIPVPTEAEQLRIIQKYEEGLRVYRDTVAEAEAAWNRTLQEIQNRIL